MKFAFIIPMGLWIGGVEKYTQQVAVELAREGHLVDYYFTENMRYLPSTNILPGLHPERQKFVEDAGVRTIKVKCESSDAGEIGGTWHNTDLFEHFRPSDYDVVVGSHKGEPMWPFSTLSGVKIAEIVHGTDFTSGASTYANANILISEYQLPKWIQKGGNLKKTHIVTPMVQVDMSLLKNDRKRWGLPEDKFIFGLHQSSRPGIFSHVQLDAYSLIQSDENFFAILGGGTEYKEQAERLGLKNFIQIPAVSTSREINSFLSCLNVYAHGRLDGEVCSSAITEAMANHLPIVSHPSIYNNGHITQLNNCGIIADSIEMYAVALSTYEKNQEFRHAVINVTREKYEKHYTFEDCRKNLLDLLTSL